MSIPISAPKSMVRSMGMSKVKSMVANWLSPSLASAVILALVVACTDCPRPGIGYSEVVVHSSPTVSLPLGGSPTRAVPLNCAGSKGRSLSPMMPPSGPPVAPSMEMILPYSSILMVTEGSSSAGMVSVCPSAIISMDS